MGASSSSSNCHLHSPHKWQTTQYGQHPPTTGSCKLAPAKKAHKVNWNKRGDRSCHLQMPTSWRNHSEKSSMQLHPTFESPVCGRITPTTLDIILARYFLLDALYAVNAHFSIFLATGLNSFCQFPWFRCARCLKYKTGNFPKLTELMIAEVAIWAMRG